MRDYLTTPAILSHGDRRMEFRAYVRTDGRGRRILVVESTFGQWFLDSLVGMTRIAVDFGAGLYLENVAELVTEATERKEQP